MKNDENNLENLDNYQDLSNPYFLAYVIITKIFNNKDFNVGLSNALYTLRLFLGAEHIAIYKKSDNYYTNHINSISSSSNISPEQIFTIINNICHTIERKQYWYIDGNNLPLLKNSFFYFAETDKTKYILGITGIRDKEEKLDNYIKILSKIFPIILDRMETYDEMKKLAYEDALTGLKNRHQFNKKMKEIDQNEQKYCLAIFDLFRLKFVNDNFSHELGDQYIQKAANILKNYFPEYIIYNQNGQAIKKETANSLFRIGGDEFVVITDKMNSHTLRQFAQMTSFEVKQLDIAEKNNIPLDLNFGIAERTNKETASELYRQADAELQENKGNTYKVLGLDRRK